MRSHNFFFNGLVGLVLILVMSFCIKQTDPWTQDQLLDPASLASVLNDSASVKPLIVDVGPAGLIRGGIKIGATKENENLNTLKELLSKEDRRRSIVIYCGCCPFNVCPNIRPAFSLMNKMKFANHKVLNLPHNLKMDWINYGYPMSN